MKTAKVAISLPRVVLEAVEQARITTGECRSQYFRRAVEKLLNQDSENLKIREYVNQYTRMPQTVPEVNEIDNASRPVLEQEPW